MRTALLILLFAVSVFAASPPQLPEPIVEYRLGYVTRATLLAKPIRDGYWTWEHTNAGPQYCWFRFYGRTNLSDSWKFLGTNTIPKWYVYRTNGAIQFLSCVAEDRDMVKTSDGKIK